MVNMVSADPDAAWRTGEPADWGLMRRIPCTFRRLPPRLRVFIDFLVEQLQDQTFGGQA